MSSHLDAYHLPRRVQRVESVLAMRQPDLVLALDQVDDPHNAGAILRTADAVGVLDVHLCYPDRPRISLNSGVAKGTAKWLRFWKHDNRESMIDQLRDQGLRIWATAQTDQAVTMDQVDFTTPVALLMGNEHGGVSSEILSRCPDHVWIPMVGMAQSFNVSVAAAVLLNEAARQRRAVGMYASRRLDDGTYHELRRRWLQLDG